MSDRDPIFDTVGPDVLAPVDPTDPLAAKIRNVVNYIVVLNPGPSDPPARINIYCEDNFKLYLLFKSPGEALPANEFNTSLLAGVAYVRIEEFKNYYDLLRQNAVKKVTFSPAIPSFVVFSQ